LIEFAGPCRVADIDGDRVRAMPCPLPLVEIAATAESQTANTMRMVRAMAAKGSPVVAEHGIDPGKTIYYRPETGGELRIITSSATAAEGSESSFAVGDETEHWVPSNGGPGLMSTLSDNLAKSGSRMIETSNAWVPGSGSVAESTWDAWVAQEEGRTRGGRILYDALIAPHDTDMADEESLMAGLEHVYSDCFWVDLKAIRDKVWSLRTPPDESRRKYLNQPTAPVDAWTTPQKWGALADPTVTVPDGSEIALFFDGSKSRDATALMGCVIDSGHVFALGVWEVEKGAVIPTASVDAAIEQAFARYQPLGFFGDVREWEGYVKTTWPERYGDRLLIWAEAKSTKDPQPIAWDMRGKTWDFTKAVELAEAEIDGRAFTHDGDSRVARHVANCRRRPNRYGTSVGKESPASTKSIDAAVCVIGVRMVRRLVLAELARGRGKKRSGRVVGF
jgi:hypothetical protein